MFFRVFGPERLTGATLGPLTRHMNILDINGETRGHLAVAVGQIRGTQ